MALKALNKNNPVPGFKILVCNDGNIFLDKLENKLKNGNAVLLGVPLRLGINKIQKEYLDSLMRVFTFQENVGIAGGQDHRSLYFTGLINKDSNKDPNLIYLDPHIVQDACTDPNLTREQLDTFQCSEVRVLALSKISTSVAIGFYIRNSLEYSSFKPRLQTLARMKNSIFSVYE